MKCDKCGRRIKYFWQEGGYIDNEYFCSDCYEEPEQLNMECANCGKRINWHNNSYSVDGKHVCTSCYENPEFSGIGKNKNNIAGQKANTSSNSTNINQNESDEDFFSPSGRIRRSAYFFRALFLAIPPLILSFLIQE